MTVLVKKMINILENDKSSVSEFDLPHWLAEEMGCIESNISKELENLDTRNMLIYGMTDFFH